jgi:hypothetical protein
MWVSKVYNCKIYQEDEKLWENIYCFGNLTGQKYRRIQKSVGLNVGESHGYSVVQGTEVEVIKAIQQYTPFVYFASHPIASVTQAGEMIKALTK